MLFALANEAYSITNTEPVSIAASKKIAIANVTHIRMRSMPKTNPLADLIGSRVDEGVPDRMTYDEIAKRSGGRISGNYVNELRNGKKDPRKMSVEKIIGLARAFGDSALVIFRAATGEPQTQMRDESLEQLLADFSHLLAKDREELRYIVHHLHAQVQERKKKSGRTEISSR